MCALLAQEYGKWPHEVLLSRNDGPGQFEMELLIFDFQAMNFYHKRVEQAHAEAARKMK